MKHRHKFTPWRSVGLTRDAGTIDRCDHCGLFRGEGTSRRESINTTRGTHFIDLRVVTLYAWKLGAWGREKPACTGPKAAP